MNTMLLVPARGDDASCALQRAIPGAKFLTFDFLKAQADDEDMEWAKLQARSRPRLFRAILGAPAAPNGTRWTNASTGSPLEGALRDLLRQVVHEEIRAALADGRAAERAVEAQRLVPLKEAAARLGLTPKALRSRIERGTVPGARRVGRRWHVPADAVGL